MDVVNTVKEHFYNNGYQKGFIEGRRQGDEILAYRLSREAKPTFTVECKGLHTECPVTAENKKLKSRLAKAEELLERCRQGHINLIDYKLLPHVGYDDVSREIVKEIAAFLREVDRP